MVCKELNTLTASFVPGFVALPETKNRTQTLSAIYQALNQKSPESLDSCNQNYRDNIDNPNWQESNLEMGMQY